MDNTEGIITLSTLVDGILFRDKKISKNDRSWVLDFAVDAIRELNMHHHYNVKSIEFTPDVNGMIDLPNDWIGHSEIYYIQNGLKRTLTRLDKLATNTSIIDGAETFDTERSEGGDYDDGYRYGLGSKGGKNVAYYTIDERKRRYVLNGLDRQSLYLNYVSSGVALGGDTFVPTEAKMMIESWIRWQVSMYDPDKYSATIRAERMINHDRELRMYRSYVQSINHDEFADSLRRNYTLLPQR